MINLKRTRTVQLPKLRLAANKDYSTLAKFRADLLQHAGIDVEAAFRETLYARLLAMTSLKHVTLHLPTKQQLHDWVAHASTSQVATLEVCYTGRDLLGSISGAIRLTQDRFNYNESSVHADLTLHRVEAPRTTWFGLRLPKRRDLLKTSQ